MYSRSAFCSGAKEGSLFSSRTLGAYAHTNPDDVVSEVV